jgi:TolB-like protein/DNA-binding winged helix-turn-helix (wHTH) protein
MNWSEATFTRDGMNGRFQVGLWRADPGLNTLSMNGSTIRLEPKLMEVLVCLASRAGEPVSKDTILKTVWPGTFVSDDVLTRSVSELRRVFEDDPRSPRFIETIPKRGYRLVAPVEQISREKGTGPAARVKLFWRPNRYWIIAAAIALILILTLGLVFNRVNSRNLLESKNYAIHSLAVLPLQNLSDDPKQEYLAEGITDALITDFAQIDNLRVVSRTTIMRYGRPDRPLPQIAHELNVDGIVEGTVQRSSDRVRITAQLIYGPSDQHLWAASFERDVKDVLSLQNELANEIAGQIHVKLGPENDRRLRSLRPVNPKALDAYVEARFHIDQAARLTFYKDKLSAKQEEAKKADSYLENAIQQDPNYLPAYVAYFDVVDPEDNTVPEYLPKARAALAKALELDEGNVAAHLALARLLMQYDYKWNGAEKEYKRAIEINPRSSEAHFAYAEYLDSVEGGLDSVGDTADAKKERELAQALDPARDFSANAGQQRSGRTVDEERHALEEMSPTDPFALAVMGKDYAIAGRFKEAVEMYERCLILYGWTDMAELMKHADARRGPRFALEEWMRAGEAYEAKRGGVSVVPMAFTYASLGNKDRAFAWLDKAVAQRNWMIIYLKKDNVWDPLRTDPRFAALLKRVGLPR